MANKKQNDPNGSELTLNDVAGMIDTLAQSTAKGFEAMQRNFNTVVEMVGSLQGQVSSMETDITTIKGDVKDVHKRIDDVEKLVTSKVSHAEFNDRLRPDETKLGIPSP
jgi:predicted  nucleic acid-binding Zn-ribbon protein